MSNVVQFRGVTTLDLDPDLLLSAAAGKLDSVVIIGYEKGDDGEFWFASSKASGPEVLWLLERARLKLMRVPENES